MLTTSHPNLPFLQANDLNHATDHRTQANSRNLVPGGRDPRSGESANACAGTRAKEPRVAPFHRAQNETRSPRLLIFTPRFPLFFSRPRVHAHVRAFLPSRQAYRRPIYRSPAGRRDVIFDSIDRGRNGLVSSKYMQHRYTPGVAGEPLDYAISRRRPEARPRTCAR